MIANNLYQYNFYSARGSFYLKGGVYANTQKAPPSVTPEEEYLFQDGVLYLFQNGDQYIFN